MHFHLGLDQVGDCCRRMRNSAEIRRCRERRALRPKIVWVVACGAGREVWRNGMHRRRWLLLTEQTRADRRCFLMTLKRPPLVSPLHSF